MDPALEILFQPLEMPNLKLKNRLFMAPIGTFYTMEQLTHYFVARAKGEVGMIITGATSVHPSGRGGELNLDKDECIDVFTPMVEAVQDAGARFICQLNHAGRYSPSKLLGMQPVAPSPIASLYTGETPRELSTQEADDLVIAFADAARRAQEAGFDGIEILANTGYLISTFLSPVTNKRTDKYGGTMLQRATFLLSVVSEARKEVGSDFNISVKIDYEDGMEGGFKLDDTLLIAPRIVEAGADRLHIWAGWHEATKPMMTMAVPRGAFADYAAKIKEVVDVPVATVGRINDPVVAAEILREGKADLIGLGRALVCDPEFVKKTREGRSSEIRRCIACLWCMEQIHAAAIKGDSVEPPILKCGWNKEAGHEAEGLMSPAKSRKRIVVVGGGPAGMEFARVAAMRKHDVTLFEEETELGGLLKLAYLPPYKNEIKNIIDYYEAQLKLLNVDVKLNEASSIKTLNEMNPDCVVLSTGSTEIVPDIPGIGNEIVVTALDVLRKKVTVGDTVLVIGGGMIGIETAELLADEGKKVTVVEMLNYLAKDVGPFNRWGLLLRVKKKFKALKSTKVIEIKENSVVVLDREENTMAIPVDTVIVATGLKCRDELEIQMDQQSIPHYSIGSCHKPGMIHEAFSEAFELGCKI